MHLHRPIQRQVRGTVDSRQLLLGQALGEPVVQQIVGWRGLARAIRRVVAGGSRTRARVGRWHRTILVMSLTTLSIASGARVRKHRRSRGGESKYILAHMFYICKGFHYSQSCCNAVLLFLLLFVFA